MVPSEPPSVSVCRTESVHPGGDRLQTVFWMRGDHDVSSRTHLSEQLSRATDHNDLDVVVDLSDVTFMDASTIGAIVDAHNRLRTRSRSLTVRAPPPRAQRLFDVCDLTFLIDEDPAQPAPAPALGSWVAVPASGTPQPPARGPVAPRPAAHRSSGSTGSVQRCRTPT